MSPLQEVDDIFAKLMTKAWSEHTVPTLVGTQGRLSVLSSNIIPMVSNAYYEFTLREQHAKQCEAERFVFHKKQGSSDMLSGKEARVDAGEVWNAAIEAKHAYKSISGVLDAMQAVITACQVTRKSLENEMKNTNYVQNS